MGEIKIGRMVLGTCSTNMYFVYREGSQDAVVIDPADYGEHIYESLQKNGFQVAAILLTHGHFDHIWGCEKLRALSGVKVYANEAERDLLGDARKNISAQAGRACTLHADAYLKDGDVLELAGITFQMIATPGHTPGGCCYYMEEAGMLICGDTLFEESVGRTDFPGGSMSTLVRSIKEKLFTLPDNTKCYPGHGGSTTIGYEKQNNPFCV